MASLKCSENPADAGSTGAGWKHLRIEPIPGGDIDWVKARFISPTGTIEVHWEIRESKSEETFYFSVNIPPNLTAEVRLPTEEGSCVEVGSRQHKLQCRYTRPPRSPKKLGSPWYGQNDEEGL